MAGLPAEGDIPGERGGVRGPGFGKGSERGVGQLVGTGSMKSVKWGQQNTGDSD